MMASTTTTFLLGISLWLVSVQEVVGFCSFSVQRPLGWCQQQQQRQQRQQKHPHHDQVSVFMADVDDVISANGEESGENPEAATANGSTMEKSADSPSRQPEYGRTLNLPSTYAKCSKCFSVYALTDDDLGEQGRGRYDRYIVLCVWSSL